MGEYAHRKIDGKEVKIGTCSRMYYCRYDQTGEINYPYMTDNLIWRIPNPDEDGTMPGDYECSLLRDYTFVPYHLQLDTKKFSDETISALRQVGTVQLHDPKMGLLVNLRCPHGLPLDDFITREEGAVYSMGYNGHQDTLHLSGLKNTPDELLIEFECASCGCGWDVSFSEIEPMIKSLMMKLRLLRQVSEYHYSHSIERREYTVNAKTKDSSNASITSFGKGRFLVKKDDCIIADAPWHIALIEFISLLPKKPSIDEIDPNVKLPDWYDIACQADNVRSYIYKI